MKEKHVQGVIGSVQVEQGRGDTDELRLGVKNIQLAIFRTPNGVPSPQAYRIRPIIDEEIKKRKWYKQFDM